MWAMSHVALLVMMLAASDASNASSASSASLDVTAAVEEVMTGARDAVRIAVPPIVVDDAAQPVDVIAVEKAIVRALLDRGREQVLSPASLRLLPRAAPTSAPIEGCDHTLLARIELEDSRPVLRMRLIFGETGEVLATASTLLPVPGAELPARAGAARRDVHAAADDLVAEIAWAVEAAGDDVRTHRTAVISCTADDTAAAARLDRFLASELQRALVRRGFLVVERAALDDTLATAPAERLGRMLGAQSVITGAVATTGATFTVSARVVSTSTGAILGAASTSLPREGLVALADVETRTPLEAAVRSAIAPGWGQAYNRRGDKAVVFALAGYGSIATTAGLGVGGVLVHARYRDPAAFDDLPPAERAKAATETKALGDGLYVSAVVAGAIAASVWSLGIVDAIVDSRTGRGSE